jgi:outer membrane murein-binding lipoprotein Lpp
MSIHQIQVGYADSLNVRLLDTNGDPVTGVAFSAITVTYKKQGDTSWNNKSVLSEHWTEGAVGRYTLLFTAAELDTSGKFVFRVAAAGAETYIGDLDILDGWATIEVLLTDLINGLSSKVSTSSVAQYKKAQDETIQTVNAKIEQVSRDIERLNASIAAARRKLDGLS